MLEADVERVASWFTRLYEGATGFLHIASTGNWAGRAFDLADGLDPAVEYVLKLDALGTAGIYSRVTTLRERPDVDRRGGAALARTVPALWADVDLAGPGHKHVECDGGKACWHMREGRGMHPHRVLPLPPDVDAGMSLIEDSPLPLPSLWVHSGGGLYPIWLLDPRVEIDSSGELAALAELSGDWQQIVTALARERGWHYGSGVGDLARVLRIPGTWNRKVPNRPARCCVLAENHLRYTIGDLYLARNQVREKVLSPEPASAPVTRRPVVERPAGDVRPGDDFTARVDWSDELLLGGLGWRCTARSGGYREWLRPNAAGSLTATTGRGGMDNLWVFSTETVFPAQRPISKLEAFRISHGHATHKDAVRALSALGFGSAPHGGGTPASPSVPLTAAASEPYEETPDDD